MFAYLLISICVISSQGIKYVQNGKLKILIFVFCICSGASTASDEAEPSEPEPEASSEAETPAAGIFSDNYESFPNKN